nr:hypothetical protein [Plantibacter sp. M259]
METQVCRHVQIVVQFRILAVHRLGDLLPRLASDRTVGPEDRDLGEGGPDEEPVRPEVEAGERCSERAGTVDEDGGAGECLKFRVRRERLGDPGQPVRRRHAVRVESRDDRRRRMVEACCVRRGDAGHRLIDEDRAVPLGDGRDLGAIAAAVVDDDDRCGSGVLRAQ